MNFHPSACAGSPNLPASFSLPDWEKSWAGSIHTSHTNDIFIENIKRYK